MLDVCGPESPAAAWKAAQRKKVHQASTQGSGFLKIGLALTLLEAGVLLVDNVELAIAADDFAINATFLHRGFYFHDLEKNEKITCNDT